MPPYKYNSSDEEDSNLSIVVQEMASSLIEDLHHQPRFSTPTF